MSYYEIKMQHDEDTLLALSRMQYNLFCMKNRVARSVLSLILILYGIFNEAQWWGILLIAYGCYLTTSTYSAPNHTARKLAAGIRESGAPFPCSKYIFEKDRMRIITLPDREELAPLDYKAVRRMGEDLRYFYLFRDEYGGYMIPKEALGARPEDFRRFLQEKTGQSVHSRQAPIVRLLNRLFNR